MWTQFMDMHSGGSSKEEWQYIYIEAPEAEAKVIFYNQFDHNPERVTCTCCGNDYSISESETLEQATAYERGCKYDGNLKKYIEEPSITTWSANNYRTLEAYKQKGGAHFIYADDIKPEERSGDVPDQGYVWVD